MSRAAPPPEIGRLLGRLRRYRVGAVYVPPRGRGGVVAAVAGVASGVQTLDVLDGLGPAALDALLARDVVERTEAVGLDAPALVVGSEALWSPLALGKLDDVWRALVLTERPPAPRLLVLHSPLFLDRLERAFAGSPEPARLLRLS